LLSLRYRDAFIFEAPALVGLAYSMTEASLASVARALLFVPAGFLLMAHIFLFNDWSDRATDVHGSKSVRRRSDQTLTNRQMLAFSISLAFASLILFSFLSKTLVVIAFFSLLLGVAYSFPVQRFKGKAIPLLSSILHFAGILLAFLLGYALFSPIEPRALLIGGYLALIITAGHLVQEVQDYAGDVAAGLSTNAVRLGQRFMFAVACGLFTLSFVYLYGLASEGLIPSALRYLVALYPIYAGLAWWTYRAGLTPENVRRFRSRYRRLFAVIVSVMSLGTLLETLGAPPTDLPPGD
jgi:4-hydroxybenzoate polyprenyltransferase